MAASTGPRSVERGWNVYGVFVAQMTPSASTGPRSVERGWQRLLRTTRHRQHASTGPRSVERGWLSVRSCDSGRPPSFNGAALSRARMDGFICVSNWEKRRFNGAALSRARMDAFLGRVEKDIVTLQRGRAQSSADGAAGADQVLHAAVASTGPRSVERGWVRCCSIMSEVSTRFNGAALSRARMVAHGLGCRLFGVFASTGPRSVERGGG